MFGTVVASFHENAGDVERLIDFDRDVLDIMIASLRGLSDDLPPDQYNIKARIERVSQIVTGIRNNESLKSKYGVVCNQAVVLLVSHFASALGDIFRKAVADSLDRDDNKLLLDEEMKLTLREMRERGWNLRSSAADLLIAKKDLTFQDMQSTARAFETYVGVQIQKDRTTNNIILGQAARHVIVHSSGLVSEKMLKQVARATPRTLKQTIAPGESLVFSKEEVIELKGEMFNYIATLVSSIEERE